MTISEWQDLVRSIEKEVTPETLTKVRRAFGEIFNAKGIGNKLRTAVAREEEEGAEHLTFWYGEE